VAVMQLAAILIVAQGTVAWDVTVVV